MVSMRSMIIYLIDDLSDIIGSCPNNEHGKTMGIGSSIILLAIFFAILIFYVLIQYIAYPSSTAGTSG